MLLVFVRRRLVVGVVVAAAVVVFAFAGCCSGVGTGVLLQSTATANGNDWAQVFSGSTKNQPRTVGSCVGMSPGGDIFVVGGAQDGKLLSSFAVLAVARNQWSVLASHPTPVYLGAAVSVPTNAPTSHDELPVGSALCVFGGQVNAANLTNALHCFDYAARTSWVGIEAHADSPVPSPRRAHATTLAPAPTLPPTNTSLFGAGWCMFVFGGEVGQEGSFEISDELWAFDFGLLEWQRFDSSPSPPARHGHGLAMLGAHSLVLFWGNSSRGALADTWTWRRGDRGNGNGDNEWWHVSDSGSPPARAFMASGVVNGTVWAFGGRNKSVVLDTLYLMDREKLQWTKVRLMSGPTARWAPGVGVCGNDLFMMGGTQDASLPMAGKPAAGVSSQLWQLHVSDVCALFTSCDDCTGKVAGCGWCEATSKCLKVPSNTSVVCPRGWFESDCPECWHSKCRACSNADSCVWCESSRTCVSGDQAGPFKGTCAHFTDHRHECSECQDHSSCLACLRHEECGWCFANSTCSEGVETGPFYNFACTKRDAWWYGKDCPGCSAYSSCAECTSASNCGFCLSTGNCVTGTAKGALDPAACGRGYHFSFPCPDCSADPDKASSCRRCTGHTSEGEQCGWCGRSSSTSTSAFCGAGDDSGPFSKTCGAKWFANHTSCARCSQNYDCSVCTLDPDCAWCDRFGGYCVAANDTACPAQAQVAEFAKCRLDPPSWDPNGWTARGGHVGTVVVMGGLALLAVVAMVGAVVWWRRVRAQRAPENIGLVVQERKLQEDEKELEEYMFMQSDRYTALE